MQLVDYIIWRVDPDQVTQVIAIHTDVQDWSVVIVTVSKHHGHTFHDVQSASEDTTS